MGGCVSHRSEFPNNVHPNVFTVYPVSRPASIDAIETSSNSDSSIISGSISATGQLEVTATELILHRRGHEPVRWPLQYVRRYGYENQLFSFESGRRCESGPGIFTFRCRRAHELFLLVQTNVQEARNPPAPLQQGAVPQENTAVSTLERGRSGSMPTQFRFPVGRQLDRHVITSEAGVNEHYLDKSPGTNTFENRPSTEDTIEGVDANQVFMEVTPRSDHSGKSQPGLCRQVRFISDRSRHTSSTSNHSLSTIGKQHQVASSRPRPASFEIPLSPTVFSSQDEMDNSAFVSPSNLPTTPLAAAHYVNVNPANQNLTQRPSIPTISSADERIYHNKVLLGLRRTPGRSQSLGSPHCDYQSDQPQNLNVENGCLMKWTVKSDTSSPTSGLRSHMGNESENIPLNYVTVDIGTENTISNGRNTWTPVSSFYRRYLKQKTSQHEPNALPEKFSLFGIVGRSLSSVTEKDTYPQRRLTAHGGGLIGNTSNYARIDCKRTKALRDTAAAMQVQRRSTSASSSEVVVGNETGQSVGGRRKHDIFLPFGRRKHNSASAEP